ncbi:hypothetical protein Dimus_013009, partial [Dionaea muscipula]
MSSSSCVRGELGDAGFRNERERYVKRERTGEVFRVERPSRFTKGQSRKSAKKSKGGEDWRAERRASPEGKSGGQGPENMVGGQGRRARPE